MISNTTKKELDEYLKEHDPEYREWLIEIAKAFGKPVTVIYVETPDDGG